VFAPCGQKRRDLGSRDILEIRCLDQQLAAPAVHTGLGSRFRHATVTLRLVIWTSLQDRAEHVAKVIYVGLGALGALDGADVIGVGGAHPDGSVTLQNKETPAKAGVSMVDIAGERFEPSTSGL